MNIIINDYCNLRCSYCFANHVIDNEPDNNNMSVENFEKVLEFMKKNNMRDVRLIGGEPTLHPYFSYLLIRVVNDKFFRSVHIFSNCTFDKTILETILLASNVKKVTVLPNCNTEENMGTEKYNRMLYNIEKMSERRIIEAVGINIYKPDLDYSYIYDIATKFNIPFVRWSITTPNCGMPSDFDVKGYFKQYQPILKNFFTDSVKYRKSISIDCNTLPSCALDDETYRLLTYCNPKDFLHSSCNVILDVKPNLDVIRCFGLSEQFSVKLEDFIREGGLGDLYREFNEYFSNLHQKPLFEECTDCMIYKRNNNRSCTCLNYKL